MRLSLLLLLVSPMVHAKPSLKGALQITVMDATGNPVYLATVTLKNPLFGRTVRVAKTMTLKQIPPGSYRIEVRAPNFEPQDRSVIIKAGETEAVTLTLTPATLSMGVQVVAPSQFSLMKQNSEVSSQYLDRDTVSRLPRFGDDLFRALNTVPGTSSNDFGSAFTVRGGEYREVHVTLDGMELYEPFHIKDFTGIFSFIAPETLGGITLNTGGFDATYGNALSGVMALSSSEPSERRSHAQISLGGLSYQTEGRFNNGLGQYVFSARRGYLDVLLSLGGDEEEEGEVEDTDVTYWDSYGKLAHALGINQTLSFNYLLAADGFVNYEEEGMELEDIDSDYDDQYFWMNHDWVPNDQFSLRNTLYSGRIDRSRFAFSEGSEERVDYRIDDQRETRYRGFKTAAEWEQRWHFLRFGIGFRQNDATFRYTSNIKNGIVIGGVGERVISTNFDFDNTEYHAYITDRFQLTANLNVELGLRFDHQSEPKDDQLSPRLNARYQNGPHTFRLAAGTFHQAERGHELQVADGVTRLQTPEKATHLVLGYERRLPFDIDLRVEGYYKKYDNLRTRFVNLTKSLVFYPGLSGDRVAIDADQGRAYGFEIVFRRDIGSRFSFFGNYAWSHTKDELLDGRELFRPWDQRHTLNLAANYRAGRKWNINGAWIYHTGWRTTPFRYDATTDTIEVGAWFSDTFPAYYRLDLRINRAVYTRGKRSFEIFVDIANVTNRKNIRGTEDFTFVETESGTRLEYGEDGWFPILPSFGITWRF
ncbi:TonB-dependent receptor [Acanthopleuribacter pedis]|nr:TonB-dependent receptor [Acanthopleuribacter pedis]